MNSFFAKAGVITVISHDFSTFRPHCQVSRRRCPFKMHCKSITGIHGIFPEPVDVLEGIEATKSCPRVVSPRWSKVPTGTRLDYRALQPIGPVEPGHAELGQIVFKEREENAANVVSQFFLRQSKTLGRCNLNSLLLAI